MSNQQAAAVESPDDGTSQTVTQRRVLGMDFTKVGILGAIMMTLGSFGAGAIRNRGGVLDAIGLSALSYGHGAGLSNVLFITGMATMIIAWVLMGRAIFCFGHNDQKATIRTIWSWIIPFLFAAPMLSRDVYSYLMQGAMQRDGFDPYTQGAAVNPGPMLLEVSHDWRNTTTPYGPLHLGIGELVTRIVGDNVTMGIILYKLISIVGFAAIVWAIPRIAKELGGNPIVALWLGVANPVMVFHLIGGMHNESVMVGLVSLGILFALRRQFILAVALVSIAVSLKATAVFALPFFVWLAMRTRTSDQDSLGRRILWFGISGAWMVVETLAVVALMTIISGSSWGWISQISGNSKVINPLALPSLIAGIVTPTVRLFDEDFPFNSILSVSRSVCQICMLLGLVVAWWMFRKTRRDAVRGISAAYTVAVVFNSVTLPWYYTSLVSLLGTFEPPRWLLKWTTGLSVIIAASFSGSGNHQLYNLVWITLVAVGGWAATQFVFGPDAKAKSPSTVRDA